MSGHQSMSMSLQAQINAFSVMNYAVSDLLINVSALFWHCNIKIKNIGIYIVYLFNYNFYKIFKESRKTGTTTAKIKTKNRNTPHCILLTLTHASRAGLFVPMAASVLGLLSSHCKADLMMKRW